MKPSIKHLLPMLIALSSVSTYTQAQISQTDQKIIEQAVLCQNAPQAPVNVKQNTDAGSKRLEAYDRQLSAYLNKAEKAIARNAGKPKKEIIDYSNYTTYTLKTPIVIRGVLFSKILVIDYEDGYHAFEATGKGTKKEAVLFKSFEKPGESFGPEVKKNELIISCTHVFGMSLGE